uniref:stathmin-like isoform X1 n=2 Tax=Myxine glutinosa TaxID=7769 RepID=UPI00358E39AF
MREMEINEIKKGSSGHAFEVILKGPNGSPAPQLSTSPKREISLDTIKQKLMAADERRKSQEADVLKHLAEKRDHEREVIQKAQEEKKVFMKKAEERLNNSMETKKEKREAQLAAKVERLHDKVKHAEEVCKIHKTSNPLSP